MREKMLIHRLDKAIRDNTDRKRQRRRQSSNTTGGGTPTLAPKLSPAQALIKGLPTSEQTELDLGACSRNGREFERLNDHWVNPPAE